MICLKGIPHGLPSSLTNDHTHSISLLCEIYSKMADFTWISPQNFQANFFWFGRASPKSANFGLTLDKNRSNRKKFAQYFSSQNLRANFFRFDEWTSFKVNSPEKNLILKKGPKSAFLKVSLIKIWATCFSIKILKTIWSFLTPEFSQEISKFWGWSAAQIMKNSKSVTLKTAEIPSIQISSNSQTATPRDRRIFFCSIRV
jgi:hypothetical protein